MNYKAIKLAKIVEYLLNGAIIEINNIQYMMTTDYKINELSSNYLDKDCKVVNENIQLYDLAKSLVDKNDNQVKIL